MSVERKEIAVFQTKVFEKAFKRLSEKHKDIVDDEIERLIEDPELGERKRGDLSHLWVHKFKMDGREVLLGYSWNESELVINLLNFGPHENFYREARSRRKADLKFIGQ